MRMKEQYTRNVYVVYVEHIMAFKHEFEIFAFPPNEPQLVQHKFCANWKLWHRQCSFTQTFSAPMFVKLNGTMCTISIFLFFRRRAYKIRIYAIRKIYNYSISGWDKTAHWRATTPNIDCCRKRVRKHATRFQAFYFLFIAHGAVNQQVSMTIVLRTIRANTILLCMAHTLVKHLFADTTMWWIEWEHLHFTIE